MIWVAIVEKTKAPMASWQINPKDCSYEGARYTPMSPANDEDSGRSTLNSHMQPKGFLPPVSHTQHAGGISNEKNSQHEQCVCAMCIPFIRMEMLIIEGILLPCIDVDSGSKDILSYCVSGIVLGIDNCLKCAVGHVHLYRVPRVVRSSHLIVVGRPNPFLDISGVVDTLRLAVMALQFCDVVSLVIDICLRDKQALMVSRELRRTVTTVEQQVSGSFGCTWLEVYLTTSDVYLVDRGPTVSPLFL